jgi:hypothetical protein
MSEDLVADCYKPTPCHFIQLVKVPNVSALRHAVQTLPCEVVRKAAVELFRRDMRIVIVKYVPKNIPNLLAIPVPHKPSAPPP